MYYIQETKSPKICLPLSFLLVIFHNAHTHDLSGHPGREKTRNNYRNLIFSNNLYLDCDTYTELLELPNQQIHDKPLNGTTTSISRSFTILQSPYFEGSTSPSLDGNSYVHFIVDAFTHYVVLHPSPKNDATHALTVLFDHWIVKFGIPDILVTDNGNEYFNGDFTYLCRTYNVQFKPRTPYAPWSKGLVENSNRQLNTFFRTVLDSQYDTL